MANRTESIYKQEYIMSSCVEKDAESIDYQFYTFGRLLLMKENC